MTADEITMTLSRRIPHPDQVVFTVTMRDILKSIAGNLGEKALSLTVPELLEARDEVQAVIGHHLDERELINLGLEAWKVTRSL